MLNSTMIAQKSHELITLLQVTVAEAAELEAKRQLIENAGFSNTEKEKRLNEEKIVLAQKEKDIQSQINYISEQQASLKLLLGKIATEKATLEHLKDLERKLHEEAETIAREKKSLTDLTDERAAFQTEQAELEKARELLSREKLAMQEQQKLVAIREERIKAKEDRLDTIERMTQL